MAGAGYVDQGPADGSCHRAIPEYYDCKEMRPSRNKRSAKTILWIECIGFSIIIALSWLDELLGLPHLLFGGTPHSIWRESALESIVTLIVWLVVFMATRRVLRRFHYLEDMLTMCSWCRKLDHHGAWLSLEDYCSKELGVDISHGMCPNCGRQLLKEREPAPTR